MRISDWSSDVCSSDLKPTQNAFLESFIGKFRDECLNEHLFHHLEEARCLVEAWRIDYKLSSVPTRPSAVSPPWPTLSRPAPSGPARLSYTRAPLAGHRAPLPPPKARPTIPPTKPTGY